MSDRFTVPPIEVYALSKHLSTLLLQDESSTLGHVRLTARAGRRRWYATDSYVAGVLEADHDGPDGDILLSPRILPPRVGEESHCELTVPRLRDDGTFEGPAALRIDGLTVTQPVRFPVYPDLDRILGDAIAEPGASAEVHTDALTDLLAVLRIRPAGSAEHLSPPAFLTVGEGRISIHANWPGWGESRAAVEVAASAGLATAAVGLHLLQRLVDASPATVRLQVPVARGQPVSVMSDGFYGLLMPLTWPDAAARLVEVQQILEQHLGIGHVEPDADGDLPVPFEDVHAFIRTVDGTSADVQVFTVLADGRDTDLGLLERINELNSAVRGCRLFAIGGQVLLEADLPGEELSPDTLRSTLNDVADTTRMVRTLFDA